MEHVCAETSASRTCFEGEPIRVRPESLDDSFPTSRFLNECRHGAPPPAEPQLMSLLSCVLTEVRAFDAASPLAQGPNTSSWKMWWSKLASERPQLIRDEIPRFLWSMAAGMCGNYDETIARPLAVGAILIEQYITRGGSGLAGMRALDDAGWPDEVATAEIEFIGVAQNTDFRRLVASRVPCCCLSEFLGSAPSAASRAAVNMDALFEEEVRRHMSLPAPRERGVNGSLNWLHVEVCEMRKPLNSRVLAVYYPLASDGGEFVVVQSVPASMDLHDLVLNVQNAISAVAAHNGERPHHLTAACPRIAKALGEPNNGIPMPCSVANMKELLGEEQTPLEALSAGQWCELQERAEAGETFEGVQSGEIFAAAPVRVSRRQRRKVDVDKGRIPLQVFGCQICIKLGVKRNELKTCSQCRGVWYCSKECQRADWKWHKKMCKDMSKAASN